jgi:hypothetical protein
MTMSHEGDAHLGDLVEGNARIIRKTRDLIFAQADFLVNGEIVMSSSSTWKIISAKYRIGG